jgi:hypothetical protein
MKHSFHALSLHLGAPSTPKITKQLSNSTEHESIEKLKQPRNSQHIMQTKGSLQRSQALVKN